MSEDSELPIRQSDRRDAIEQSNYISHQQEHNITTTTARNKEK